MNYYDLEGFITSYCSSNSKTCNSTTGFALFCLFCQMKNKTIGL